MKNFKFILFLLSIIVAFILFGELGLGYYKAYNYRSHPFRISDSQKRYSQYYHWQQVNKYNYADFWYASTFPTQLASVKYHTRKHGNGKTPLEYTRDAVEFYENNQHLKKPYTLYDGTKGYKINKGKRGGIWTQNGKIVTFWG